MKEARGGFVALARRVSAAAAQRTIARILISASRFSLTHRENTDLPRRGQRTCDQPQRQAAGTTARLDAAVSDESPIGAAVTTGFFYSASGPWAIDAAACPRGEE